VKNEIVFFVFGFGDVISVDGGRQRENKKKEKEREKKKTKQRGQKAKSVSDLCSIQIAFDRGEH